MILDPNNEQLTTSNYANPYMFTGRRYDSETGLYYYRFRYYRPEIGRFLQTDPIGYYDSMNLYEYCLNNPINWIDPYGLRIRLVGPVSDRKRMYNAIERLRGKSFTARKLIRRLEESKKVYKMKLTIGGNQYNWLTDIISYNPNKNSIGPQKWQKRPAEVGLAHELIHALHDIHDGLGNFVRLNSIMVEEYRTIGLHGYEREIYTENRIRSEYGLQRRPKY